jgi:hypothetical protein
MAESQTSAVTVSRAAQVVTATTRNAPVADDATLISGISYPYTSPLKPVFKKILFILYNYL